MRTMAEREPPLVLSPIPYYLGDRDPHLRLTNDLSADFRPLCRQHDNPQAPN